MKALVLTLGHNSSAILIEDGNIKIGYEEERLSGIKSDSNFPIKSILRILELYPDLNGYPICVSHWYLDGKLDTHDLKHWRPDLIKDIFPDSKIFGLSEAFPHHAAHALSAEIFAGLNFPDHTIVVADGFGTLGECVSIYKCENYALTLKMNLSGFNKSIGLFYQYATKYCGMKMNQHEYKMLAYETHMSEILSQDKMNLAFSLAKEFSHIFLHNVMMATQVFEKDLTDLKYIEKDVYTVLDTYLNKIGINRKGFNEYKAKNRYKIRVAISYFTQFLTEEVIINLIKVTNPKNLILVGGVFFNVKLNNIISELIPGKVCIMPLAGDQGAGLGVYQQNFKDLKWPEHLFWGTRDKYIDTNKKGIKVCDDYNTGYNNIVSELKEKGIVNLVRGAMEFGPRTLCNTSTLAIPTLINAMKINEMNQRTNEMPFALVVTQQQAEDLFLKLDKIHKSLEYMIITREFKPDKHIGLEGGAHYYPIQDIYTCRPQITYDPWMIKLLNQFGPLINTSFNFHGEPIVFNQQQIEYNHKKQQETYPIITVIIKEA